MDLEAKDKKKKKEAGKGGKKGKKAKLSEREEFISDKTQVGPTESVQKI